MISKAQIEQRVTEEQIFRKYIRHNFKLSVPFLSELRNERNPSANVFRGVTGRLLYKDFADSESYDCYGYVAKLFNTDFKGALEIIAQDFYIANDIDPVRQFAKDVVIPEVFKEENNKTYYEYEIKPWEKHEISFWNTYGIVQSVLEEYEVFPVSWVQTIKEDNIYAPKEASSSYPIFVIKVGEGVKIYMPYEQNPRYKWLSNTKTTDIFGLPQAIKAAEDNKLQKLGLLAGQKDVMSLFSNTGLRSIALNSESSKLRFNTYIQMTEISEWQFILYDNDRTGIKKMKKVSSEYPIIPIYINKFLTYSTLKGSSGINDAADWYKYMIKKNLSNDRIANLIEYEYQQNQ